MTTKWKSYNGTNNGTFSYSSSGDPTHRYGISVLLDKNITRSVLSFTSYLDDLIENVDREY